MRFFIPLLCSAILLGGCVRDPPAHWTPLAGEPPAGEVDPLPRTMPTPRLRASGWTILGRSVEGREILARTLGRGPLRVYLIASIHGDEGEGRGALDSITQQFGQDRRATLRIVRDMNPDGSARQSRTNANGVDLNRNWPASNFRDSPSHGSRPLSEPETIGVHEDLISFDPDLVVVFHSSSRVHAPFVNYDGPAQERARVFARAARPHALAWSVVPRMGYPTPGSLGTSLGVDRGVPVLTIEFRRGQGRESVIRSVLAGLGALLGGPEGQ